MKCQNPLCKGLGRGTANTSVWCSSFCRIQGSQGICYNPDFPNNVERLLTDEAIEKMVIQQQKDNRRNQKLRNEKERD